MQFSILIIDDDHELSELIARKLEGQGYEVLTATDGQSGVEQAVELQVDLVLTDLEMPGWDGLEVIRQVAAQLPETTTMLMTGKATLDSAIESLRLGAADYIRKPIEFQELTLRIARLFKYRELQQNFSQLKRSLRQLDSELGIIGTSEYIKNLRTTITILGETNTSVLIRGETGSGKEVVAKAIHNAGPRTPDGPFVALNCAAVPEDLFEAELFGYEKGAYTGAHQEKAGLIETANHGTLFLDEIGDLPAAMQAKLLRVLEERQVQRIGSTKSVPVDLRIVSATNQDLAEKVQDNSFRSDLYFRINVMELHLPPLRERPEDIPLLAEAFREKLNVDMQRGVTGFTNQAMTRLVRHAWPGNVRELRNAIERAMLFCKAGDLDEDHLQMLQAPNEESMASRSAQYPEDLEQAVRIFESDHIACMVEQLGGNKSAAAERLGIDRSTLYRKLQAT